MSTHSLLSPSSSHRWAVCAASVRLTRDIPNTTNARAQRGTDIHQLGEMLLRGDTTLEKGRSVVRADDRADAPMFYIIADMLEEATQYANYVKALMTDPDAELMIEAKADLNMVAPDTSGHVDAVVINGATLHIIDLKTGRGEVSAENNSQLMLYALGIYHEIEMFYDIDTIKLHIVQDNQMITNTNSWELGVDDLLDFGEWIAERAKLALAEDSECTPTEKACQWCSYSSKCKALFDLVNDVITGDFADLDELANVPTKQISEEVSIEEMTNFLSHKKMIDNLVKAYEERIFNELSAGNEVSGFKLVMSRKNKAWINETEAYDKLKTWLPLDDVAPRKLVSPSAVEKMLGKSISTRKKNVFDELYETPAGQPQLAPASDKRPSYKPTVDFDDLDTDNEL